MRISKLEAPLVDIEAVLRLMGCKKDDPSYEEYMRLFEEVKNEAMSCVQIKAAYTVGELPPGFPRSDRLYGKKLIYYIITAGSRITELSDRYFENGEYMKGMIVDAIADNCLFFCENEHLCMVADECRNMGYGVSEILDAPTGIPEQYNTVIAQRLNAEDSLGVRLNEAYMFSPIKTYACILLLSDDTNEMNIYHDCSKCSKKDCSFRVPVNQCHSLKS